MREFDLLKHVYRANERLGGDVVIPPGDDMALVRLPGRELLAAVDQLVDGRHVQLATTPIDLVGRKAIARSLSDVAAMAGHPVATLVAVTLPPGFGAERARALFDAMRVTAERHGCPLIGGDIAVDDDPAFPLTCAVTVLATPHAGGAVRRSGARIGDTVFVTGTLGGAVDADGRGRHLTFAPRIAEAIELADTLGKRLHAMIDLSDGLGRDAGHVAVDSGVRLEIDVRRLPLTPGVSWREAAGGGEDYELLFTAVGAVPPRIGDAVPVTAVGRVLPETAGGGRTEFVDGDARVVGDELGWEHE